MKVSKNLYLILNGLGTKKDGRGILAEIMAENGLDDSWSNLHIYATLLNDKKFAVVRHFDEGYNLTITALGMKYVDDYYDDLERANKQREKTELELRKLQIELARMEGRLQAQEAFHRSGTLRNKERDVLDYVHIGLTLLLLFFTIYKAFQ